MLQEYGSVVSHCRTMHVNASLVVSYRILGYYFFYSTFPQVYIQAHHITITVFIAFSWSEVIEKGRL